MVQLTELEAEIQQKALLIHSSLVFMSSLGSSDMQPPPTDSVRLALCHVYTSHTHSTGGGADVYCPWWWWGEGSG